MHSTASFNELKLESSQIVSLHITTASTKDSTTASTTARTIASTIENTIASTTASTIASTTASTIAATKTFTPTSTSPCTSLTSTSTGESTIPLAHLRCFSCLRHLGGTDQSSYAQQRQYTFGGFLKEIST